MIPYRGDPCDHMNNGQYVNRHMLLFPQQQQQQQQQMFQPPPLMYVTPTPSFQQSSFPINPPLQYQPQIFTPPRPRSQQPWTNSSTSLPNTSMPTLIQSHTPNFHHIQPQPSFSGGTGMNSPSFGGGSTIPKPTLGPGTGIPQPPFSGGTAVLKRKLHYLEESDYESTVTYSNESKREIPSLMNMPPEPFVGRQQQHHQTHRFRPANPHFTDNHPTRLPAPFPPVVPDGFHNQISNSNWANSDRPTYSMPTPILQLTPQDQQQTSQQQQQQQHQITTSQLFQKHQLIPIDRLMKDPGRLQRAPQIIIFLRGLPGSGKSYVAELIKSEEELQSKGTNKPKILSIDNYFVIENERETKDPKTGRIVKSSVMEYEYDQKMEEIYRRSLIKLVRKSIDDRFYPFLIVDQNNEQIVHFRDMADYAEANQFQVYFVELTSDPKTCAQRNIHHRTLNDIENIHKSWEQLPLRYEILDIRSLLQSDAIDEVEMDDAPQLSNEQNESNNEEHQDEEESQITKKSKWETIMEINPDRLDGVYQRRTTASTSPSAEIRLNDAPISLDDQTDEELSTDLQSKKKKVRWADIVENDLHLHRKAVGFVVGQTEQDWQRMSDDYDPTQKLNQYKYI